MLRENFVLQELRANVVLQERRANAPVISDVNVAHMYILTLIDFCS